MDKRKRIVLIAHDRLKPALVEWARSHIDVLEIGRASCRERV